MMLVVGEMMVMVIMSMRIMVAMMDVVMRVVLQLDIFTNR